MNDTTSPQTLEQHFDKCFEALMSTQRTLMELGTEPAAMASALGLCYVNFVTTIAAAVQVPRAEVERTIVDSLGAMKDQIDKVYANVSEQTAKMRGAAK